MEMLRARNEVPYVRSFDDSPDAGERLVILPAEDTASTSRGRPIGAEYYDVDQKLKFMDKHGIDISVISLANPWLDWLPSATAAQTARMINDDTERLCSEHEGRLYAFATLPLSASTPDIVTEIARLKELPHMRGVVMGTSGLGQGLDDPALDSVYAALQEHDQLIVSRLLHCSIKTDLRFGSCTLIMACQTAFMDRVQVTTATCSRSL